MKVISLFSGAGGMDLGFEQAGWDVVWANDNWQDAVETYRRNLGRHIVCADLQSIDAATIPEGDIVTGGFPCQGFSVANTKRHVGDKRNRLYGEFLRVVEAKLPPMFLAENVKGILSLDRGRVFELIVRDFSRLGYVVDHAILNAADYGVPQRRERVFIFGRRRDISDHAAFPPSPTHARREHASNAGLLPWVGVGEALCEVPDPDSLHELANHEYTKYKLRFNGYLGHRQIDPLLPAPTMTARGDDRGGVVIPHHPSNTRRMSARETATVQSFPLDFVFYGSKTSAYRQIANAVPPLLARVIATGLRSRRSDSRSRDEQLVLI